MARTVKVKVEPKPMESHEIVARIDPDNKTARIAIPTNVLSRLISGDEIECWLDGWYIIAREA